MEDKKEEKKKKSSVKKKTIKVLNVAMPVFLGIVIVFSIYKLISIQLSYKEANDEYAALTQEYAFEEEAESAKQTGETVVIQPGVVDYTDGITTAGDSQEGEYPRLQINYEALMEINDDFRAWIRVPVLDISYPVVRADDNEHYLNYTFEGKWNGAGCIFIDYENSDNLSDYNTYIYGHNMKNGSMFGSLKRFRSESELCATDPYFYIYTQHAVYKYEIFAYYRTEYDSDRFMLVTTENEYDYYVESAMRYSEYTPNHGLDFSERPNIITLSTCSGTSGTKRLIVHGVLIATYENAE